MRTWPISLYHQTEAALRRLVACSSGNVFVIFGLVFPVILGCAGLAVDTARFYDQHERMQTSADATALAVAKELNIYRKKPAELKALGKSRAEVLLAEAGIGRQSHSTEVGLNPATNLVEVSIQMVRSSFLPANMWGRGPCESHPERAPSGSRSSASLRWGRARPTL